jgi:hypothetical protein
VGEVTRLMGTIAEASAEQARGVQQVNKTVTEMDRTVQHNASAVQESAAAAEQMRQQAEDLVRIVNLFSLTEARMEIARISEQAAVPAPPRRVKALATATTEEWKEF